ncbi:MAG: glycosyltransferase family 9 protein [Armatimonadota bacterium]|nr:glycosyltransferase family 9 protein [Armatimonadota bacterium]
MRALDRWAGPVLVRLVAHLVRGRQALPEDPRHIVVVKLLGIGALVLAEPALRALGQRYPKAKLSLVTFAGHAGIAPLIPAVTETLEIRQQSPVAFLRSLARVLWTLRRRPPDLVVDLETSHFSALLSAASGAACRVGFRVAGWRTHRLYTHAVDYDEDSHARDRFLALAGAAGAPPPADRTPRLHLPPDTPSATHQLGVPADRPVVAVNIHVGALCPERRWPLERFVALCRRLLEETNASVVLIGSPGEAAFTAAAAAAIGPHPRLYNAAGKLSLVESVSLLAQCAVVVSSDSGAAHLAAAVGTPTITLFGPESPSRYGPPGQEGLTLYRPAPCSPCLTVANAKRAPCRGRNVCMWNITVAEVYALATRVLQAAHTGRPSVAGRGG